eukprot:comp22303_c0_seq1/m.33104 comp22303_c0_seq1/g.33104  ORF comp22303_c0_seq1/g.33104 comp22303_c0_seq1/m.33104 type:complete len:828 (-) comp22303_c0_seq1:324-2807(-)
MGRDKKTAKGRLDRYYHMAKEQGFRSRAAFKLIQLNKKFNFLSQSRCVMDLCAAPGGWLQVAAKYCPVSSVIIGVDRVAIKPIRNCITLTEDITTEKCRQSLKKELKTWQVDCVLHDGAPNVGTAWVQDAFSQVELALKSLQLATEFLRPGGWFVTKVFRSKDYFAFMWVLGQLFTKVHATKPSASRNVSAEIFVVCQGYKAPAKIDPRMLDPKCVFQDVEAPKQVTLDTLVRTKKSKAQPSGYEDGNYTQHKTRSAAEFVSAPDALTFLASVNQISLEGPENANYAKHKATDQEIRACFEDVKVLGKKEIRALIKWRDTMRKAYGQDDKKEEVEEIKEDEDEDNEDVQMTEAEREALSLEEQIEALKEDEKKKEKHEKRKAYKEKLKLRERLALKMDLPGDQLDLPTDSALFSLNSIKTKDGLGKVVDGSEDQYLGSDIGSEIESDDGEVLEDMDDEDLDDEELMFRKQREQELEDMFAEHQARRQPGGKAASILESKKDKKEKAKTAKKGKLDASADGDSNPLLVDLDSRTGSKADMWFSQNEFKDILGDEGEDELAELDRLGLPDNKRPAEEDDDDEVYVPSKKAKGTNGVAVAKAAAAKMAGKDTTEDDDGFEVVPEDRYSSEDDDSGSEGDGDDGDEVDGEDRAMLDPQGLALGNLLLRKKSRMALIDDSYNRNSWGDEDIPTWFKDHEDRFNRAPPPVPKDLVEYYQQKMKELNTRPIKKVAEAKARKKMKMLKKLEAAKKKAEQILNSEGGAEQKAKQIEQLLKKSKKKTPREKVTVVVAKKNSGKNRPAGVKGRYKMVDKRQLKDRRNMDRKEKKKGKR